jgi:hypothetical protein
VCTVILQEAAFEAYKAQFMEARTVDELNEWYHYFHMLLPKKDEEEPTEDGPIIQKRPKRASKYDSEADYPCCSGSSTQSSLLLPFTFLEARLRCHVQILSFSVCRKQHAVIPGSRQEYKLVLAP